MTSGSDLGPLPSLGAAPKFRPTPGAPAGLMRRCAAVAVDLPIAVAVVLGPLLALDPILDALAITGESARTAWRTAAFAWLLAFVLGYSPVCVSRWGGTPGKRVMGIEVIRASDGARLGYGPAVVRHVTNLVANAVPVLLVANVSSITLSPNRQGVHDKTVGSRVIHCR
ncbi:RDD family protein [Streptomyces sp. NPDC015661]|uniref:RDD family protein n=1 Tax=Streptomyces sp. NPDC015661 TaxID=3364961 RepID=UPI0036FE8345